MLGALIFFIVSSTTLAIANANPPCESEFARLTQRNTPRELIEAEYFTSNRRTPEHQQVLNEFKNTPAPVGKTVSLSSDDVMSPASSDFIAAVRSAEHRNWYGDPTLYEERVFHLKKGDTVVFGDTRFKLGEFLGAGDASHIFAIEGHPDLALRIPFGTSPGFTHLFTYYKGRIASAVHNDAAFPSSVRRTRVIQADPENRFVVVERAFGQEDGKQFLKKHRKQSDPYPSAQFQKLIRAIYAAVPHLESPTREEKALLKRGILPMYLRDRIESEARQFIWDPGIHEWVLVDLDLN